MTLYATVKRPVSPGPEAEVVDLAAWCQRRYRGRLDEAQDLLARGDAADAAQACREAFRFAASAEEAALLGADAAALAGDPEAALAFAREAVDLAPDDPEGYHELGTILMDLGRFEEALVVAEHAVDLAAGRADDIAELAHVLEIEALYGLGRRLDARALLADGRRRGASRMGLLDAVAARLGVG